MKDQSSDKLTDAEFCFLQECDRDPGHVDEIGDRSGMPLPIAAAAAKQLHARGLIEAIGDDGSALLWGTTIEGATRLMSRARS